ncbi:MAG: GDP-mannose 4,6-dehydratase [bacterium]|nr:GDP-mannose 4,6-dehydratase [bacterium]
MQTILVTGGAGFIGSHLSQKLLKDPEVGRVVCVDNLDPVYPVALKKANLALLTPNKKFAFYNADIRERAALARIFKKERPDAVIHLAAKTDTRASLKEPEEYAAVNIGGTLNLLEVAKDAGIKNFIFISSSSVYGNSAAKPPFKESETTDMPLSFYGATKKAGEVIAYGYSYNYGLPVTCVRLFNVYGERMRSGLVLSRWVDAILAGKEIELSATAVRKRDFTYIADVVDALVAIVKEKRSGYAIFNIASSHPAPLTELLALVEKACDKKAIVKKRESNRASIKVSHADITKAKRALGWKPKVTLAEGVSRYVSWARENRSK